MRIVLRIAFVVSVIVATSGCVERTITVKSEPAGAHVYFEGNEVGMTPLTVSFVHHGTRAITLFKPGYEKLHVMEKIDPPWFQWFPIDFFTEVLWPGTLKEEHTLEYKLEQAKEVPTEEILERAKVLRDKAYHVQP